MSPEAHAAPLPIGPNETPQHDRDLIDRIIYLGSLASERGAIDPMMETLREVTAHWQDTASLIAQDRRALQQLETQLKTYLVTKDPLRAFTPASLEQRLQEQAQPIHKGADKQSLAVVLAVSVLAAGIGFALPLPLSFGDRLLLSTPLFFLALHIGIAWFYLSALRQFNKELKRAFFFFCLGIIVLSIGFSHYVVTQLLQIYDHPVLRYGGVTWLICIPFILMFIGLRIYAQLLKVKSRLMSLPATLAIVGLVALVAIFAPHAPVGSEVWFDFWALGVAMIPTFALMGSVLARKISQASTLAYSKSLNWLYYYTLVVGLGSVAAGACLFIFGELYGVALNIVIAICGIPPQLVLLYTGYLFKKETVK
jgi:hypothetical protein